MITFACKTTSQIAAARREIRARYGPRDYIIPGITPGITYVGIAGIEADGWQEEAIRQINLIIKETK